jgi:hypothetical protein
MINCKIIGVNNMNVGVSRRYVHKKAFLVIVIVIIASMILVVFLYSLPLLIMTERLRVGQFQFDGLGYGVKVFDSGGNDLAHPYLRVPSQVSTSPTHVLFSIWHAEGTKLDSLTLVFSSDGIFSLALIAPEGFPWPRTDFHETSDGRGVILDIPDLKLQGEGTVTLEFFLQLASDHLDLNIRVEFSLHKKPPFSFTRYTADASLNVAVERLE